MSKTAIIGVGLLGGSLARALKKQKGMRLVGWNHRAISRRRASHIIQVSPTFEGAVEGANTIVLCSHSSSIIPALKQMEGLTRPDVLIMDVSSVKGRVSKQAQGIRGISRRFVPCHPMAGKEKSGPAFADARLFAGKNVFITPLPGTPRPLLKKAIRFWKKVGAIPVVTDAVSHDKAVALTSHLTQILASSLIDLYGRYQSRSPIFKKALGSGFRDFTRIAASNPAMWRDIMVLNSNKIRYFLLQYRRKLGELEKNLKKGKGNYWFSFFKKTRSLREKL